MTYKRSLTPLFIGLRLAGVTTMSWLWVLSPLWLPACLLATVLCVAMLAKH